MNGGEKEALLGFSHFWRACYWRANQPIFLSFPLLINIYKYFADVFPFFVCFFFLINDFEHFSCAHLTRPRRNTDGSNFLSLAASFRRIFAAKITWFLDGMPIINADITSHSDSSDEVSHEELKKRNMKIDAQLKDWIGRIARMAPCVRCVCVCLFLVRFERVSIYVFALPMVVCWAVPEAQIRNGINCVVSYLD